MSLRLRELIALWLSTYILSVLAKVLYPGFYTDIIALYYRVVVPSHNGIPYHAYWLEYPAIPAILIWVSGLAPTVQMYMWTMAFLMSSFVVATVYFLYRICTEFGMDRGRIIPFLIMAPSFLVMSFFNWDILAVCFVSAAFYYAFKKKLRIAGFCLGLGFAAKAYPLLLFPAFVKEAQSWPERFEMLLAIVLGGAIPNLPFIIVDFSAWVGAHGTTYRAVYIEDSIWMLARYLGFIQYDWIVLAVAWSLIFLTILHMTFSRHSLVLKAWVIAAVTMLVYPSYPPQYNLWLLPMFVLNPAFGLIPFLVFDFLDTSIILSWFSVDSPFQPWGIIWNISLIRIGLLVALMIWVTYKSSKSNLPTARVIEG
jgi:uncharacterized membrane protein